ncbi:hypothetical protein OJF2_27530 [Aquisphaera giovannonii]|uniref:Prenyltransferase and squalene oxidase repeat protein n=1 Tax=Aquisphaera giovannonii TaxID=406548 RepID=A0A5B9W131_9BACT|nr:hypothetical protein [Aquisphaera giovannonii]QEH34218.1 hypothetical protein OJF2_27530 [Aquisphaera giovannonii]
MFGAPGWTVSLLAVVGALVLAAFAPQRALADGAEPASPGRPSLYELADDQLLSIALYSSPHRMASRISNRGAVGVNADWEAGRAVGWYIEEQRYGADLIQAGLVRDDPALVSRGWEILDWGLARQAADGSFAGTGDPFHSTSLFAEAMARALVLTAQSGSRDAERRLATSLPAFERSVRWLAEPSVAARGARNNAPYTHRRWVLAAAMAEAAAAVRLGAGRGEEAEAFERIARDYAADGLRLQAADGMNPERGGADASYQAYGLLMAERYLSACTYPDMRIRVRASIVRGLDWLASRIDERGGVDVSGDTRTGVESSRSGRVKGIDYKSMLQAFSIGASQAGNPSYRDVAIRLAASRGWLPRIPPPTGMGAGPRGD